MKGSNSKYHYLFLNVGEGKLKSSVINKLKDNYNLLSLLLYKMYPPPILESLEYVPPDELISPQNHIGCWFSDNLVRLSLVFVYFFIKDIYRFWTCSNFFKQNNYAGVVIDNSLTDWQFNLKDYPDKYHKLFYQESCGCGLLICGWQAPAFPDLTWMGYNINGTNDKSLH